MLLNDFDVAVIGGGCAGSSAAQTLARHGYQTLLIDWSADDAIHIGEVLPPAIQKPLTRLGLWQQFLSDNHLPSSGIYSSWGRAELHDNNFIFDPYGSGWHVDRTRFQRMLLRSAENSGAIVWRGGQLLRCESDTRRPWEIEVGIGDERRRLTARFVIDATGRTSLLARRQGARRISYDRLIGMVAFFDTRSRAVGLDGYMILEAVDSGWWYSACLPESRLVVAYMTDADLCPGNKKWSINHWKAQLEKAPHTLSRAAGCALESGLFVYAANSSQLDRSVGSGWLAAGDAAAAFDPLSAQGLYKALDSGLMAARSIHQLRSGGKAALQNYELTVAKNFRNYLLRRDEYYARERRWTNSTFWRRRHIDTSSVARARSMTSGGGPLRP
jgi:flavin-dependent dehydrogenase